MFLRNGSAVLLTAMVLACCSQAQQSDQQVADVMPVADERAPVPAPVSSSGASLAFTSEQARTNYLRGGIGLRASYDDNTLNSASNTVGDLGYAVMPHIAWDRSTPRLHWIFDYAAGLTVNQRLTERNQGSHDLGVDFQYRLSPHVDLHLTDRFSLTTGFFNQLQGNLDEPTPGVVQQPNQAVITPLAKRRGNSTTAGVNYQFGAGSIVGATGSFYDFHFSNIPQGSANLLDTRNVAAEGFYTHRLTPKNWMGLTYRFQQFTFQSGTDQTVVHTLLYFHTIYLQPRTQLSVFAGPEYSNLDTSSVTTVVQLPFVYIVSVPVTQKRWSATGGASYSWQGEHTSVRVDFVRKVSDGGGLLSTVRLNSVTGALRRQLTRSWIAAFGAGYAKSDSLGGSFSTADSLKSASGSIAIERQLGTHVGLQLGYARDYQQPYTTTSTTNEINHNRGWVSLSYDFSRLLGR
jgi:hypothetical protein